MICRRRSKAKNNAGKKFECDYYCGVTEADGSNERGFCQLADEFLCIERLPAGLPRLSFSSISDFITCKRLYFLKHIKGIQTLDRAKGLPLKRGSLWDLAVEVLLAEKDKSKIGELITKLEIPSREVAKVKSLFRAWKSLEINVDTLCKTQVRFELPMEYDVSGITGKFAITGVFDRLYSDHFAETKLSGSPDWYTHLYNIIPQVGTYFMSDPGLGSCTIEITRCPDLKSTKSFKDESDADFEERCYQDIISRPSFYFIGWNKDTHTFGKKFYRSEFPLEEIRLRYAAIFFEMTVAANHETAYGAYWKDWKSCMNQFGPCEFLDVCHHDKVSEEIFTMKKKPAKCGPGVTEAERLVQLEGLKQLTSAILPDEIDGVPFTADGLAVDDDVPF